MAALPLLRFPAFAQVCANALWTAEQILTASSAASSCAGRDDL